MANPLGRRPTKSLEEHRADGTYRPQRHDHGADVEITAELPPCPADRLNEVGRAMWQRVVDAMPEGALKASDAAALEMLSRWWQVLEDLSEKLQAAKGDVKTYAMLVRCQSTAATRFESMVSRFGLSPVDRLRLRLPPPPEEPDELDLLMQRRWDRDDDQ